MTQRTRFENSVVWITGASSGIGRELARQLSARGARTVLTARREDALRETRGLCSGGQSVIVPGDLSDFDGIDALADTAEAAFGRIDMLVLNAGISQRGAAVETEPAVVYRVNAVNFLAPVRIVRRVVPRMTARGSGHVVAVSSLSTRVPTPQRSAYTASKAALETYLTVLRRELVDSGVSVTVALPGFVRTEISLNALNADGSTHGILDPAQAKGMEPGVCARRIISAIERGRREILIPSDMRTRLGLFLHRRAPGLLDRMMAHAEVT
ncbi:MAG: SDR family NAD(P)-dependent oxidoreductase [Spirochaetaceae bacterium]